MPSIPEYKQSYIEDNDLLKIYKKYRSKIGDKVKKTFPPNVITQIEASQIQDIVDEIITALIMNSKNDMDLRTIKLIIKNSLGEQILKVLESYIKTIDKEVKNISVKEKKDRDAFKRKMKKNEIMRKMKRYKNKLSKILTKEKIKNNGFCINNKDYILLDDIEELSNENLIKLHYKNKVHCLHVESIKGIFKSSSIPVYSLEDKEDNILKVYKLPLSFTLYIGDTMKNYILKKIKKGVRNFRLLDTDIKVKKGQDIIKITSIMEETDKKYGGKKKKSKTVKELKQMCKKKGLKKYSKLKKRELLKLLKEKK